MNTRARAAEILVVDADPTLLEAVTRSVDGPIHVRSVHDAYCALYECAAARPDLIVMEVVLPGVHGIDLLQRLRARECSTPAIVVTHFHPDVDALALLGVVAVMSKPVVADDLGAAINAALALGRTAVPMLRAQREVNPRTVGPRPRIVWGTAAASATAGATPRGRSREGPHERRSAHAPRPPKVPNTCRAVEAIDGVEPE